MPLKHEIGAVFGRFQPLHLGHMDHVLAAFGRAQFVYVGITNPDPSLIRADGSDPHRSEVEANPCTYYERLFMLEGVLAEYGLPSERFAVVPYPINVPELIKLYTLICCSSRIRLR